MDRNLVRSLKYSFCHSSFVYNNIQNYRGKTLTFDTRNADLYSKYKIEGSINLNNDRVQRYLQTNQCELNELNVQNIAQLLKEEETSKFAERKRCFCTIIMTETSLIREFVSEVKTLAHADDKTESFEVLENDFNDALRALLERIKEEESVAIALNLFRMLKKDKLQEVHVLIDGASDLFHRYPFLDHDYHTNLHGPSEMLVKAAKIVKLNDLPNDILDGRIFLGNCHHSKHYEVVNGLKISHIVNAAFECGNAHENRGVKYLKLAVRDETDDRLSQYFKQVYDFITEALEESKHTRVLVHCAMGKSRSATIVIMYIMKKFSWGLKKAFEYVKSRRSLISPYHGFLKELEDFELKNLNFVELSDEN